MKKLTRRLLGTWLACTVTLAAAAPEQTALTIVIPYPPGAMGDAVARLAAQAMTQEQGRPVVVENRPGANGVIGLQAISRARPDGNTIGLVTSSALTINPSIYKDMKVDTVKDLTPLTLAMSLPNVLVVNPAVPARTMAELLAHIKANPGKVSYASMGNGSSGHLNGELLQSATGTQLIHVPYKGGGLVLQGLLGGQVDMAFENISNALPHIQAGKLRALAITTATASPKLPDVPPIANTVPGFQDRVWFAYIGPKGLPAATTAQLHAQIQRAMKAEPVQRLISDRGATAESSTPEALSELIGREREKWAQLIKERDIHTD